MDTILVSLGSGRHTDVQFLFMNDICGESKRIPRHARPYADLNALHRQVHEARTEALRHFRVDVMGGGYPAAGEISLAPDAELSSFIEAID